MVGILVDHDLVRIPKPVVAIVVVWGGDAKVETSKPEAFAVASGQPPDVGAANAAGETAVLKRMVEMVPRIIAAGGVPNPRSVGVDMGSARVPLTIAEIAVLLWGLLDVRLWGLLAMRRASLCSRGGPRIPRRPRRSRAVGWNVTMTNALVAATLPAPWPTPTLRRVGRRLFRRPSKT